MGIREFAKWNVMAHPVPDINLDGRPMEGNTYLEPSALGVSLDSGLMEGLLCPEPLEQSVLGELSVIRPDETGSGITDASQTVMFSIIGVADAGSEYN